MNDIHGIYPMLYAFFDKGGNLDRGAMKAQVQGALAQGVHGIAVGGLATETNKMSTDERRNLIAWAAEDIGGQVPLSVTIAETSVAGQTGIANYAADLGAAWVVLQPPPVKGATEAGLIDFYGAVADSAPLPVGIQNAPEYIGIGVSNAGFAELHRRHPNVSILKAEGPATYINALREDTNDAYTLFNGRNGMELVDSLRAGCHGMIPGLDACDRQVAIYNAFRAGDEREADRAFAEILPLLSFLMGSIDHLLCYGKRLTAKRLGFGQVYDRTPALQPSDFGMEITARWSKDLKPF
ncbi:MAG: dihydrodipicolinate synthase family protein [Alphaproteobacteria bacterium]|jgi:4-hydroxy-tetrahydrodipicolinate synthase|nr:dihydrodipicolinate synthase family protein [Alphaproteobacteria bacterium]